MAPRMRGADIPNMVSDNVETKQRAASYDSRSRGFFSDSAAPASSSTLLSITSFVHACLSLRLRSVAK